ncbi:MAG: VWA domain-containing protein [Pyrinomonadaceae bacterium]
MKRIQLLTVTTLFTIVGVAFTCPNGVVLAQNEPAPVSTVIPVPLPTVTPVPGKQAEEDEIVKVDTELVNLNVRVVDRNSRPINNVQQDEFKIYEDNVLQQIDFFSRSEVPTNYTIVVDNSGSLRQQLEKVIDAGKILVNTNRPDDQTSLIRFVSRDKITVEQPFTSNKTDLLDALDNLYIEGGQTAIIDAVYLAADAVNEHEKRRDAEDRRRRALVLVSDGEDRDSFYNETQLFQLLRETDVQIYVVGFVGDLSKEGGFIGKSPQGKAKAFLERLAVETGGKPYFPDAVSDLPRIAGEIATELRTQYSIGYIPSNERKDGSYRNIKVVVSDGPSKQKRIAISRTGRTADQERDAPSLVKPRTKTNR